MTASLLELRVGDRLPSLTATVLDEFGDPVPLTGYRGWMVLSAIDTDSVLGHASPYMPEITILDAAGGRVQYDWQQDEMDAAVPGRYHVRVRFVNIADPTLTFEVPDRNSAFVVIRPRVEAGRTYLLNDTADALLLDDYGQPILAG